MCAAAKDHKNQQNPLFWEFKVFKVIDVNTTEKLISASACCDMQHAYPYLQPFSWKTSQQQ